MGARWTPERRPPPDVPASTPHPRPPLPARRLRRRAGLLAWLVPAVVVAGDPAPTPGTPAPGLVPFSSATGSTPPPPWRVVGLPGSQKPLTRFDVVRLDGTPVLRVTADHSYANLVHPVQPPRPLANLRLAWRWRLDQPLLATDLQRRSGDDSALRLCVAFDVPLAQLPAEERSALRWARVVTGEPVPAATLCYVWDHLLPVGTLLPNAFTHRVRDLVVDSGETQLMQWRVHQRDLAADFRLAFGAALPTLSGLPPVEAVLVGGDADNTRGHSLGHVGDVTLSLSP